MISTYRQDSIDAHFPEWKNSPQMADDPITALDATIQAQILDLLNGIKRRLGIQRRRSLLEIE